MKNNPYEAHEIWDALVAYIRHVGEMEGVTFLTLRYEGFFDAKQWEILQLADQESEENHEQR